MLNILIIDDSRDYRTLLKELISRNYPDAKVDEYDPNVDGIPETTLNWNTYSIVLLDYDLGLENETGLDWLQILMTYPNMPPIIILTSENDSNITVRALKLGAVGYLLKTDVNADKIASKLSESLFQVQSVVEEVESFNATTPHAMECRADDETQSPESVNVFGEEEDASDEPEDSCLLISGYTITREIAKGGMSTVLLARRLEDDLNVVLKVLFTRGQEDPSALKRFMQEYNLIAAMNHPHVIRIYERAFASEFAYIALEYLPQGDLTKRISKGISAEKALSYLRQITLGLGAIHELNIIHRDLKPGNILFQDEDTLKITDFGAAKIISDEMQDITVNNMIVGTPYYMSPEQGTGMKVDQRSDIYSLGVLFYLMLTGKKLFTANSVSKLVQAHLNEPVPKLPGPLSKYQPLIEGMLAKDPDERFQIASELIAGIDWIEQS